MMIPLIIMAAQVGVKVLNNTDTGKQMKAQVGDQVREKFGFGNAPAATATPPAAPTNLAAEQNYFASMMQSKFVSDVNFRQGVYQYLQNHRDPRDPVQIAFWQEAQNVIRSNAYNPEFRVEILHMYAAGGGPNAINAIDATLAGNNNSSIRQLMRSDPGFANALLKDNTVTDAFARASPLNVVAINEAVARMTPVSTTPLPPLPKTPQAPLYTAADVKSFSDPNVDAKIKIQLLEKITVVGGKNALTQFENDAANNHRTSIRGLALKDPSFAKALLLNDEVRNVYAGINRPGAPTGDQKIYEIIDHHRGTPGVVTDSVVFKCLDHINKAAPLAQPLPATPSSSSTTASTVNPPLPATPASDVQQQRMKQGHADASKIQPPLPTPPSEEPQKRMKREHHDLRELFGKENPPLPPLPSASATSTTVSPAQTSTSKWEKATAPTGGDLNQKVISEHRNVGSFQSHAAKNSEKTWVPAGKTKLNAPDAEAVTKVNQDAKADISQHRSNPKPGA